MSYDNINDEIVSSVIGVLKKTGNRPHTVKELSGLLQPTLNIVENSANPNAIISSRLNAYLKRSFNPSSPCLLTKELITTHPRRIYFYLSTVPHLPIPQDENISVPSYRAVVSPALSDEDEENRRRSEMSPSPEVDLSSHELDDENEVEDHVSSLSSTSSMLARERTSTPASLDSKSALSSPPLEGDEREFSQSAIYIERRSASREAEFKKEQSQTSVVNGKRTRDDFDGDGERDITSLHSDGAESLLGYPAVSHTAAFSSPLVGPIAVDSKPKSEGEVEKPHDKSTHVNDVPLGALGSWGGELERHLGSPETVELDELDNLLDF